MSVCLWSTHLPIHLINSSMIAWSRAATSPADWFVMSVRSFVINFIHSLPGDNPTCSIAPQQVFYCHHDVIIVCSSWWTYWFIACFTGCYILGGMLVWGRLHWVGGSSDVPQWPLTQRWNFGPPPPRITDAYRQILWRTTTSELCLWRHCQFNSSLSQPWWVLLILLCSSTHTCLSLSVFLSLCLSLCLALSSCW